MAFCGRDVRRLHGSDGTGLDGSVFSVSRRRTGRGRDRSLRGSRARLERWIGSEVEAKGLPALSIALVDDQRIVWARGFGFADPKRQVPATADTVYRVGSVSKLFTDLAVMQLVEQGRLDLDAPVSRYLPEFAPRNPFNVPITLRQLMSHRSGLVREPPVGHYFDPAPPKLIDVVRSLAGTSLVFEPGTRTKYSNAGVAVVGAVVERVRREPFASAIEQSLLEPLGMSRSSFEPGPKLVEQMASGLMWTYDGQSIATPTFLLGTGPAGNLVSTVVDLGRFVSFLLADGRGPTGPIVKPDTLKLMTEPQLGKPGESPPLRPGLLTFKLDDHRRIAHGGAVYGFATELECLPDAKLGAIVITSVDCANGIAQHIAETALRQVLAVREGRPLPVLETTKPIPRERARKLEGRLHQRRQGNRSHRASRQVVPEPVHGGLRSRSDAGRCARSSTIGCYTGPNLRWRTNQATTWRSDVSEGPDRQARRKSRSVGWADWRIWLGS